MPRHSHERAFITPKVIDEILQRISEGEPLTRICGPDRARGMPDRYTVHRRLRDDKVFRLAYLVAREAQAAVLAEEAIAIADGRRPLTGQEGNVGRDWLRVSTRQWLAGVMAPRIYGAGRSLIDEMADLEAEITREAAPMDDIALAAKIAAILDSAKRRKAAELAAQSEERALPANGESAGRV